MTEEISDDGILECERCHQSKPDVRTVIDPYSREINDEDVMMDLCEECEHERRDDI